MAYQFYPNYPPSNYPPQNYMPNTHPNAYPAKPMPPQITKKEPLDKIILSKLQYIDIQGMPQQNVSP
jgi:hypothetical protein